MQPGEIALIAVLVTVGVAMLAAGAFVIVRLRQHRQKRDEDLANADARGGANVRCRLGASLCHPLCPWSWVG